MARVIYDPHCVDLAEYFLHGEPARQGQVHELAGVIQEAIEDWIKGHEPECVCRREGPYEDVRGCPLHDLRQPGEGE